MDHDGGVEQAALGAQRRADQDHRAQVLAGLHDPRQPRVHPVQQRGLVKQVLAGVGGQAELGKDDQRRLLLVRGAGQLQRAAGVESRIADPHVRNRAGDADKAVAVWGSEPLGHGGSITLVPLSAAIRPSPTR